MLFMSFMLLFTYLAEGSFFINSQVFAASVSESFYSNAHAEYAGAANFDDKSVIDEVFMSKSQNDLTLSPVLFIDGKAVSVSWEQNKTVNMLSNYLKKNKIEVSAEIYGGFEQVGSLPQSFVSNDEYITARAGDIVLYAGRNLVIFFGENTYSYTRLGHINLSDKELTDLLNKRSVSITIDSK